MIEVKKKKITYFRNLNVFVLRWIISVARFYVYIYACEN